MDQDIATWTPQQVDDDAWLLVRPGARRQVRRLGPPESRSSLVFHPPSARARQGKFERAVGEFLGREHVAWLLRRVRADVVLDVGANRGQYAATLRRNGFRGRIVSFEPMPTFVEHLREASADDPDWHVFPWALGNENGTAEIHASPSPLSSLLPASDFGRSWNQKLGRTTIEEITVRRLEDVWDEVFAGLDEPRPFLKMDTQGFDLEAFRGAGDTVQRMLGMQSEVSMVPIYEGMPRFPEALAVYEAAGFETSGIFPITRDPRSLRAIEFDLMMVGPAYEPEDA